MSLEETNILIDGYNIVTADCTSRGGVVITKYKNYLRIRVLDIPSHEICD